MATPSQIVRKGTLGLNVSLGALTPDAATRLRNAWTPHAQQPYARVDADAGGSTTLAPHGDPLNLLTPDHDERHSVDDPYRVPPTAVAWVDHLDAEARAVLATFAAEQTQHGAPGAVVLVDHSSVRWVPTASIGDAGPETLRAATTPPSQLTDALDMNIAALNNRCRRGITLICHATHAEKLWTAWGGTADAWAEHHAAWAPDNDTRPSFRAGATAVRYANTSANPDAIYLLAWSGPYGRSECHQHRHYVPLNADLDEGLYAAARHGGATITEAAAAAAA